MLRCCDRCRRAAVLHILHRPARAATHRGWTKRMALRSVAQTTRRTTQSALSEGMGKNMKAARSGCGGGALCAAAHSAAHSRSQRLTAQLTNPPLAQPTPPSLPLSLCLQLCSPPPCLCVALCIQLPPDGVSSLRCRRSWHWQVYVAAALAAVMPRAISRCCDQTCGAFAPFPPKLESL